MSETAAAFSQTREQVAHKVHSAAVESVRRLEAQLERTFGELAKARHAMVQAGIETHVKMTKPVEVAWAAWQSKQHAEDAIEPTSLRVRGAK